VTMQRSETKLVRMYIYLAECFEISKRIKINADQNGDYLT